MPRKSLFALLVATVTASSAFGASSEPYVGTQADQNFVRLLHVGCRLGTGGGALPTYLSPSFAATGSTQKLDATVKLYVEWVYDTDDISGVPQEFDPPVAIDDEMFADWFGDGSEFEVTNVEQTLDQRYKACPDGYGLAAPTLSSYPINSDGEMTIQDRFGGIGDRTVIEMFRAWNSSPDNHYAFIYVGWEHPGTWFDDVLADDIDALPGDTWYRRGEQDSWLGYTYIPMHVAEWVSADIATFAGGAGASPRYVDLSDVVGWGSLPTGAVRWGFDSESPANSPTFQADFVPFAGSQGYNDSSETSAMAYYLSSSCSAGKPTDGGAMEARTIMEWFGYAEAESEMVVIDGGGLQVPRWDLLSPTQHAIAMANPSGYLEHMNTAVQKLTWSDAKRLYR